MRGLTAGKMADLVSIFFLGACLSSIVMSVIFIVQAVHYQRTVHAVTSSSMTLCSKTVKIKQVVLCSLIDHGMTPFHIHAANKNSVLLRSSAWHFENLVFLSIFSGLAALMSADIARNL